MPRREVGTPKSGSTIGNWTYLNNAPQRRGQVFWNCRCACGRICEVQALRLLKGTWRECRFCARSRPRNRKSAFDIMPTKELRARWLNTWKGMMHRCYDQKTESYRNYGGRGIFVHSIFHDKKSFAAHIVTLPGYDDPTLSLDRIDNNFHYWPGNLRMATQLQQTLNRRPRLEWISK